LGYLYACAGDKTKGEILMVENNESDTNQPHDELFDKKVAAMLRHASDGNVAYVTALLQDTSTLINTKGPHPYWGGQPYPLQVAAEWGRKEIVELLLNNGADPNAENSDYDWTALQLAIHRDHAPAGHNEIVQLLIARGATVDIWAAASMGDIDRVRELLTENPGLIDAKGPNHANPLHFAATVEVAELLLSHDADPDALDIYGKTPAAMAAAYGNRRRDVTKFLMEKSGKSDIFLSCAIGDVEGVGKCLAADPNLLTANSKGGETPLNVAALHGQLEVAKLLLDRGVDPNLKAQIGHLPMHCAARNGHIEVAKLLLDRGADINAREDNHDSTPVGWARFQGQKEMEEFLRSRGGLAAVEM
jgi:ankyrin repeat protein